MVLGARRIKATDRAGPRLRPSLSELSGRGWLMLPLVVLSASCKRSSGEAPASLDAAEPPGLLGPIRPLPWAELPIVPSAWSVEGWDKAVKTWATATTAYAREDVSDAAATFLHLAQDLGTVASAGEAEQRVMRSARCLAFENHGVALSLVAPDAAQQLEALAEDNEDCQFSLRLRAARASQVLAASTSTSGR